MSAVALAQTSLAITQADFAVDLIRAQGANTTSAVSPITLTIALAVIYLGSAGETASQISNVIAHDEVDRDEVNAYYSSVVRYLNKYDNNPNVTVSTANRVFLDSNVSVLAEYKETVVQYYNGSFEVVNFSQNAFLAAVQVNKFAYQKTHGKIMNVVNPLALKDVRLLIANAAYFKGLWETPFRPYLTQQRLFFKAPYIPQLEKFLTGQATFPYYATSDYKVLSLPYAGQDFQFVAILPNSRFGLEEVLNTLTGRELATIVTNRLQPTKIDVRIPKFKIEGKSGKPKDLLQRLGIQDAFTSAANFSGISDIDIAISDVVHKAAVEIDEKGIVGAAATGISYIALNQNNAVPSFDADHPFAYFIVSRRTKIVIFAGVFAGNSLF